MAVSSTKWSIVLLVAFASVSTATAALSCVPPIVETSFEKDSAAFMPQQLLRFASYIRTSGKLEGPKCLRVEVVGYADAEELLTKGERLDVSRAKMVAKLLTGEGGLPVDRVEFRGEGRRPFSEQKGLESLQRTSETYLRYSDGRWHCDPASSPRMCGAPQKYSKCYLELKDGTLCNVDKVSNPDPIKYSAILEFPFIVGD